jgi:peptidoglycan/LPS O-acetylase OafA/YrhL
MGGAGHIDQLTGVRALAIGLVLVTHFWTYPEGYDLLNRIAASGWIGIDLFFVLSGYLISRILLAAKDQPRYFVNFYARRSLRIFPAYYALLVAVLVVLPLFNELPGETRTDAWMYWLYLGNFALASGWQLFLLDITWSLSVEEQFYLLWPWMVKIAKNLMTVCLTIVVVIPFLRFALWHTGIESLWLHMMMPLRADAFAWGALLALGCRPPRLLTYCGLASILALVMVGDYHRDSYVVNTVGYSLNAMVCAGTIAAALDGKRFASALSAHPIRFVGTISYGVYLYHPLCSLAASFVLPELKGASGGMAHVVLLSAISIAVAAVSYRFFETPFLKLKRFFEPESCRRPDNFGARQTS